jgi:succinoglycan biosynthesis transport protein ExoP
MGFGQFLLILRARRLVALSVFGAVVALAVAASLMLPKKYVGVASVVVENNKPDPVAAAVYAPEEQSAYLATQV